MKCPMKKYEQGDPLVFKNVSCGEISLEDIKRTRTIQIWTYPDEPPSIEVIAGSCEESLCAWWCEDAQKCALLVIAESQRKAVKK